MVIQAFHFDAEQGAGKQRSEAYLSYGERAAEPATQFSAKRVSLIGSFADKLAGTVERL